MSSGVAGVDGPEVPYNEVDTLEVEAPTVACGMWGGELDATAPAFISCDVDGNRAAGFLLCFSKIVVSLCSLPRSLYFLCSLTTSFLDSLPSLSLCSFKDKTDF